MRQRYLVPGLARSTAARRSRRAQRRSEQQSRLNEEPKDISLNIPSIFQRQAVQRPRQQKATPSPWRQQHQRSFASFPSSPPSNPPNSTRNYSNSPTLAPATNTDVSDSQRLVPVPDYLNETYWWAYVHPNAVKFFERQWLVNAILWGNFNRLRDWALSELSNQKDGLLHGATLQIACVYGDLTPKMAARLAPGASISIVDVVQAQLDNLKQKLAPELFASNKVSLLKRDASNMEGVADHSFDQVLLFFLLHEMPADTRAKTLAEACRVVRPGGRIIIVDYHKPHTWNPHKLIMYPVLTTLEPFAMDLWNNEVSTWLPASAQQKPLTKELCFGGLYQKIIVQM